MTTQPFPIEDVLAAYKSASIEARDVFNDEKTTEILVALDTDLHLDDEQAFVLGQEVGYVLIGLTDQNDFTDRLKTAGFSPENVNAILFEVMKKIFLPLSKKLNGEFKKNTALVNAEPKEIEEDKKAESTPPTQPLKPNPVSISVPRYMSAPPLQSPLYVRSEAKVPQLDGAVLPPKMTTPRAAVTLGVNDVEPLVTISRKPSTPPQSQLEKVFVAPQAPAPRVPASPLPAIAPVAELPRGEEVPVVRTAPTPPVRPTQAPPAPMIPDRPIQIPPTPSQSVATQSAVQTGVSGPAPVAAPNTPPQAPVVPKAVTEKGYASDPYREPIDEKGL